jgi:5-methylcytosine-specific restriction endonuclease McrA
MSDIPAALADLVRLRARGRCEYCQLSQLGQEAAFHIDHIIPRAANGPTVETNLALACVSCSLRKVPAGWPSIRRLGTRNRYSILASRPGGTTSAGRGSESYR